jgi:hypothetical protein
MLRLLQPRTLLRSTTKRDFGSGTISGYEHLFEKDAHKRLQVLLAQRYVSHVASHLEHVTSSLKGRERSFRDMEWNGLREEAWRLAEAAGGPRKGSDAYWNYVNSSYDLRAHPFRCAQSAVWEFHTSCEQHVHDAAVKAMSDMMDNLSKSAHVS